MKPISIEEYVFFGTALRYLQDCTEQHPPLSPEGVLGNIEEVQKCLKQFTLKVSLAASGELDRLQRDLLESKPKRLSAEWIARVRRVVSDLRKIQQAECSIMFAYIITEKRHDVYKLMNSVSDLFAPGVFDKLSAIQAHDITESAKCIAFERPTAAAFHVLRATESVLRALYCISFKSRRVDPLLWGPMTKHLRARKKLTEVLLNNLDNIRNNFRNPTHHPDMVYDIDAVQDLFPLCVDVITRMVRVIPPGVCAPIITPVAAQPTPAPTAAPTIALPTTPASSHSSESAPPSTS